MADVSGGAVSGGSKVRPFAAVLTQELAQVDARRAGKDQGTGKEVPAEPSLADVLDAARERRLVGLAFSGGGIRSATFNLGVLQGLAGLGLLRFFDYLSTVSGGGYIGGWLAAWVRRRGLAEAERQLDPEQVNRRRGQAEEAGGSPDARGEPGPIRHLRRHTSYLAPRRGFLSA